MTDLERADEFLEMWFSPDERLTAPTPEEVVPALSGSFGAVRLEERRAIVGWLRKQAAAGLRESTRVELAYQANRIERGEHEATS